MNKKFLRAILSVAFLLLCAPASAAYADDAIRCEVINGDTLVVSGTGEMRSIAEFIEKTDKSRIKKLVVGEGITQISVTKSKLASVPKTTQANLLPHLEKIILPDSLVEIGDYAFTCNEHLTEVAFGKNLRKVGEDAFAGCDNLKQAILPDTVTEIGWGAFLDCVRLKKIVLPASLSSWDSGVVCDCPSLREVVNRSNIPCEIPWYKKYVTWTVDGKKAKTIPPRKTGKTVRKKIPITFHLRGGKATGKLPESYRFGDEVKLPNCVKKKGYVFMGWSTSMYDSIKRIEPGQKKAVFYATWYKYKVTSDRPGTVTVTFDSTDSVLGFNDHAIRYSTDKRMWYSDIVYYGKRKGKVTIRNLWPGRTYYFQICGVTDADYGYEKWKAKRAVAVCR